MVVPRTRYDQVYILARWQKDARKVVCGWLTRIQDYKGYTYLNVFNSFQHDDETLSSEQRNVCVCVCVNANDAVRLDDIGRHVLYVGRKTQGCRRLAYCWSID